MKLAARVAALCDQIDGLAEKYGRSAGGESVAKTGTETAA